MQRSDQFGRLIVSFLIVGGVFLALALSYNQRVLAPTTRVNLEALRLDAEVQAGLSKQLVVHQFAGVAVVLRDGQVVAQHVNEYANRAKKLPNTVDTMFEINSIQKNLTAALVMKQITAGRLALSTPLSRFYPQVSGSRLITIRHLLDMTSGLSARTKSAPGPYVSDANTVARTIANLKYTPQSFNQWQYEPVNYVLLVGILEQVSGYSYQQLFQRTFVQPLGLRHTRFAYDKDTSGEAVGYANGKDGVKGAFKDANVWMPNSNQSHAELGTGQVFMSVGDLYRLEKALLDGILLTQSERQTLFKPGSTSKYGGGLYLNPKGYHEANGAGPGYQSFLRISLDGKRAVILMTNYVANDFAANKALADALTNSYLVAKP